MYLQKLKNKKNISQVADNQCVIINKKQPNPMQIGVGTLWGERGGRGGQRKRFSLNRVGQKLLII